MTGYEIDGYHYFKLRDMGEALQFDVDFDADSRTVILQSKRELDMETVPQEEMDFILVPDKKPDVGESALLRRRSGRKNPMWKLCSRL